jgi:selenocysteine lyase/cysteine desulfurase
LQLIRAALAYQLRNELGFAWIKEQKETLLAHLRSGLEAIDGCEIYGNVTTPNIGIVSFNIKGYDPYVLCRNLSEKFGVQTRAGCSCAGPYGHDLLGVSEEEDLDENPGWLRISVHFSQTKEEIDFLLKSLYASL